ncbi:unnamed protein product [Caenorhabditis auriculariae]|uniref:non-specific serine/threonine protein kinase n=1 Tax=Caenorhabditis auriculariae TaxID=2777116 RepID=A0A8S1HBK3_9PELO|nr:unnamed protein product [Caenorhabditis auriculariae]
MILTETHLWEIVLMLGAGSFGQVYKVRKVVQNKPQPEMYAMKTENKKGDPSGMRLKIEVHVMEKCHTLPESRRKHFVKLFERGSTEHFKWIVMNLVGPSLDTVRQILKKNFSVSTAMQCGLQTLEALSDLHSIGFLHRDIKPANFCIGSDETEEIVFMLDFGIARRYLNEDGTLRASRTHGKFKGTPRFCSRAAHLLLELGRKDDVESWLFMLFDFYDNIQGLPWKGKQKEIVFDLKKQVFTPLYSTSELHSTQIPKQMRNIVTYINNLKFECEPDYKYIKNVISMAATEMRVDLNAKLDWKGQAETLNHVKKTEEVSSAYTVFFSCNDTFFGWQDWVGGYFGSTYGKLQLMSAEHSDDRTESPGVYIGQNEACRIHSSTIT